MSKLSNSLFDSIKESLRNDKQPGNASFRNILRTSPGNVYVVRLVPNIANPEETFFHYGIHAFTSLSTNSFIDATCPRASGERCPICEHRMRIYKSKSEEDRNFAYSIRTQEKHMVNAYVISDPSNPENEGTIKIIRFGKQLYEKIQEALAGDDADEFGASIFDLTEEGCSFKIKVESTSEGKRSFTTFTNSRFISKGAIPGMTAEKIEEIQKSIFDLKAQVETKTTEELEAIVRQHLTPGAAITTSAPATFKHDDTVKPEKVSVSDAPINTESKMKSSPAAAVLRQLDNLG